MTHPTTDGPSRLDLAPGTVEFFYDVGSPYSYLASTRMEALESRLGVSRVIWRPFLLGGVFKSIGAEMKGTPNRMAWQLFDLGRWARHLDVPFQMSSRFPLNTLKAMRALTAIVLDAGGLETGQSALREASSALFHAYWAQDRDISDPVVLAELLGADRSEVDQRAKDALRRWTDEAVARGAFGAPTCFVGDAMHWGNDRLHLVEVDAQEATGG